MTMETELGQKRIEVIDIARFWAMALVFYGHYVERFMMLKNSAGFLQYKFIYSFHMMLFFVLAGYVAKDSDIRSGIGAYLKQRFISRLLPFVFFTIVFMVIPFFFKGDFHNLVIPSVDGYVKGLMSTLFGLAAFCVPSWFILLIFSVELLNYAVFRFLSSDKKVIIAATIFYVAGYWFNTKLDIFNPLKGRIIGWNYLFIHEAVTMYAFYLLGIYLRRKEFLMKRVSAKVLLPGIVLTALIVYFTYKLNTGSFTFYPYDAVVILFSSYGHFLWFVIPAVAGSFMILFIAKLTPSQKTIRWLGQNTLILMCLNGIFYHYINGPTAKWILDVSSGSGLIVFGTACLMTIASLVLCIPFIYLLNRCIPQLVGKPKINGPLFKRFI